LKQEYEVEVEWLPFELHPEIPPEGLDLPPHVRARFGGMSERLKEMAREGGMEMVTPDIIPSSRRALEASEFAREKGKHEEFHHLVFQKFYGQGMDLHDWRVLRAAAEELGLDAEEMEQLTEQGRYKEIVDRSTAQAQLMGITAVPAFIFDNKYAIVGAQPYEAFIEVMSRLRLESQDGD
jgi:predicted DsbA family dithiol-disulfide isomerase